MHRTYFAIRTALATLLTLAASAPLAAQIISVRSVPVATGDQFLLVPSRNIALGDVSIALDDPLRDPFVNPAKGARVDGVDLFAAPVFYGVADDGSGRTLPVGIVAGSPRWFGAASVAVQQLASEARTDPWIGRSIDAQSAVNLYAAGALGTRLGDGRTSIALGVAYSDLSAVDGVDRLYATSVGLDQDGHSVDYRVGLLHEAPGRRTFEAILLHNRFDVAHDVEYMEWQEDPTLSTVVPVTRVEKNIDRTHTWGLHLGYRQPIAGSDWLIGGILTGNYKSHPKIPNYEIMNIPRDPGHSWAYDIGIGFARDAGPAVFGVDLIFEPIRSDTWAEAAETVETASGGTLAAGERTVENEFRFANAIVRIGAGHDIGRAGVRFGLQMRSIHYDLEQHDHIREIRRNQSEHWIEWTPTWGLELRFPEIRLGYVGRATIGTGTPGLDGPPWFGVLRGAALAAGSNFLVAPQDDLALDEANVMTHQFSISIPLGSRPSDVTLRDGRDGR